MSAARSGKSADPARPPPSDQRARRRSGSYRAPEISVIVPHYNDLANLQRCLAALAEQDVGRSRYEVIVADNGSPQGEEAVREAIAGRARLVLVQERGAGPARNGGARAALGSVFAFTDSDCRPASSWLREGVAALTAFDVVGGAVHVTAADEKQLTQIESFERVFAFKNRFYIERRGFTVTANLFCSRATFEDVGPFRNGVPEDVDWSHRATAKGYSIGYCAAALIEHPARRTWVDLLTKWRRLDREAFSVGGATMRNRARWAAKGVLLPFSALFHTPKVLVAPELRGSRRRLAALSALHRIRWWRAAHAIALALGRS